jgi:hypothetical protein
MDSKLTEALAKLKAARGEPSDWLARQNALSRHIAELPDECRVLAIGEHRYPDEHSPAALVYEARWGVNNVRVHYAGADNGIIFSCRVNCFHSNIPHKEIAREVFIHGDDDRTAAMGSDMGKGGEG